jgi:hypothetical protein
MMTTTQEPVSAKIVLRLQKLLAIADKASGASETEMELAMAKAQELLAEHNITMANVFASGGTDDEKREKTEIKLNHGNGRGAMYLYQHRLMKAIAEANFCVHFIRTTDKKWTGKRYTAGIKMHVLLGRESNVIACRLMFEYLNETMERIVPINSNAERLSRSAISWKEGCSDRLVTRIKRQAMDRLRKDREEREAKAKEAAARANHPGSAPSTGTALVIRLDDLYQKEADLNEDARYGYEPGTTERMRLEREARWREEAKKAPVVIEPKPETEKERKAREKEDAKWQRRWERKEQARWDKMDHGAYYKGQEAGDKIGLDPQVKKGSGMKEIG